MRTLIHRDGLLSLYLMDSDGHPPAIAAVCEMIGSSRGAEFVLCADAREIPNIIQALNKAKEKME